MTADPRPSEQSAGVADAAVEARDPVDISVVIGFKDWGVTRLRFAVESIMESFGDLRGEVIVSDYGSVDCSEARDIVESLGARHVYTATDGVWSRSRALNAGFAVSSGRVLVSTDADMLFSPRAMEVIGRRIIADPSEALVLQCRNLPEGMGSDWIEEHGLQWETFVQTSTLRPRWGMGGMMAVSRDAFLDVRGLDERMQIYGGEDLDFAQRVRRSGRRITWLEDTDVRMYHMWHPSSRTLADETVEGRAAIEYNREILLEDRSVVRNTVEWRHRPPDAPPVASVVIATRNRASLLRESVYSALAQTVTDIEVLVIDDGSEDDTKDVVESIADPRLVYLRSPGRGIPCARNFAADYARGRYTVIHDDDDLMMPDRIEHHLAALEAGDSGSYGGWVDFDDATGAVLAVNRGKPYSLANLLFSAGVYLHGTLMLETRLIRMVRYDERFRSGSDYNLAVRLARLGIRLRHTGKVHLVRRMHADQVTRVDSSTQQSAGRWSTAAALALMPAEQQASLRSTARRVVDVDLGHDDVSAAELIGPYLPDRLVRRDLYVVLPAPASELTSQLDSAFEVEDLLHPARASSTCGVVVDATWEQLAQFSRIGTARVASSRPAGRARVSDARTADVTDLVRLMAHLRLDTLPPTSSALVKGHSARVENEAGTVLLGHWRAADEDYYLLALPAGDELLKALEAAGEHHVELFEPRAQSVAPAAAEGKKASQKGASKKSAVARPKASQKGASKKSAVARPKAANGPRTKAAGASAGTDRPHREVAEASSPVRGARLGGRGRRVGLTRVRAAAVVVVLGAVLCSAVAGWVMGGSLVAVAAAGLGLALATAAVGCAVYVRRLGHLAARLEDQQRAASRRLSKAVRDEGARTRKELVRKSRAAGQQARRADRTMLASLSAATDERMTALESQMSEAIQALDLRVQRIGAHLEATDAGMAGLGARLESGIPRATAELVFTQHRRAGQRQVEQVQSLLNLFALVRLEAGAPLLGGWAASPDVMLLLANEMIASRSRTVLECGSGSSTVWLALVARELGLETRVVALDHDEHFAEATRRELERHGLGEFAEVRLARLAPVDHLPGHATPWYDVRVVDDLADIGLLFVDGPPGNTGPLARLPAVPLLQDKLADSCVIVLDDTSRAEERAVVEQWRPLLPGFTSEEVDAEKGAVVFRRHVAEDDDA